MTVTIWHNPRCSKSRETLALLEERGVSPKIIHYLEAPPSAAEIRNAAKLLGVPLRDMIRTKENLYRELELDGDALSESALAKAMAANPVLIERPVVFSRGMARIGRPPEAILEIL